MEYIIIGYYICEPVRTPDFLGRTGKMIYSVSGCIGEQHPKLEACFWMGHEKEKEAYRRKWNMNRETMLALERDVVSLYSGFRLEVDSRFLNPQDAKSMRDRYFRDFGCEILCVSIKRKYEECLKEALEESGQCRFAERCGEGDVYREVMGCDLLGWDIGGFHSFLCNSLHRELRNARLNEYGLLANSYEETEAFAEVIQGKGEPVVWLPCRIERVAE